MKVLLVIAHPEPHGKSFSHALLNTAVEALKASGNEVKVTDIYKTPVFTHINSTDFTHLKNPDHLQYDLEMGPNMLPEISAETDKLLWATHVIFIGSINWSFLNSGFSAYVAKVLCYGRTYTMSNLFENGLCKGKKFMVATTTPQGEAAYGPRSPTGSIEAHLMTLTYGTMAFCGFTVLRTQAFFNIRKVDDTTRHEWLRKWAEVVKNLDRRDTIPFIPMSAYENFVLPPGKKTNYETLNEMGNMTIDEAFAKLSQH